MQNLTHSYRGLSLLMDLNWDRALYSGTIIMALAASSWLSASFG